MYVPEVSEGMLVRIVGFPVTQSIRSDMFHSDVVKLVVSF